MNRKFIVLMLLLGFIGLAVACRKDKTSQPEETPIEFNRPAGFPEPLYKFDQNILSNAGFKLGRKLFYDVRLSADNSVSCGSCHQPFAAFANLDHAVSHGINNCFGTRNAPPLFNLVWQSDFMWDGGVHNIELSPLNALTNACEMGNTLDAITTKLNADAEYRQLFKTAFSQAPINSQQLFKALTQFMAMLVSAGSKYDKVKAGKETFTSAELAGYDLFKQKCSGCHAEPLFTDHTFRSNGIDQIPGDTGRELITTLVADRGKFRVPSLRNIELTKPYMHDGRFSSLDEVLEHYNSGVKDHANLDQLLKQRSGPGISLSHEEKKNVITFLKTLTDNDFIKDPRFAEQ